MASGAQHTRAWVQESAQRARRAHGSPSRGLAHYRDAGTRGGDEDLRRGDAADLPGHRRDEELENGILSGGAVLLSGAQQEWHSAADWKTRRTSGLR